MPLFFGFLNLSLSLIVVTYSKLLVVRGNCRKLITERGMPLYQTYRIKHVYEYRSIQILSYAHTNRFCVVQENIKPEVLKGQTEVGLCIKTEGFIFSCTTTKPVSMSFIT